MTKDDILGMVRTSLDDMEGVHWTEDDVQDAFDDCLQLVSLLTRYVELGQAMPTIAKRGTYNLADSLGGFYRVLAVYNATTKLWLQPVSFKEIKTDYRWRTRTGNPEVFTLLGYRHMVIYPVSVEVQSLFVYYNGLQSSIGGSESLPWTARHHLIAADYVTGDLLQQDMEFNNSVAHMKRFFEEVERHRLEISNRPWGDRIATLCQRFFPTAIS